MLCACVYEIGLFSSANILQKVLCFRLAKPTRTENSEFHPRRFREVAPALTANTRTVLPVSLRQVETTSAPSERKMNFPIRRNVTQFRLKYVLIRSASS